MLHHHRKNPHHTFMVVWILGGFAVLISGMLGYVMHRPEVAKAPVVETPSVTDVATSTVTVALHEHTPTIAGERLRIDEIVEDSRCPSDVTCIQAGTVRLSATVEGPNGTSSLALALGVPATTEHMVYTLTDVVPFPLASAPAHTDQYRFTMVMEKR